MEEFRSALRVPESISRLDTVKRTSFRNSSFSLASIFATPQTFRRSSDGIPHSPVKVSKSLSVYYSRPGFEPQSSRIGSLVYCESDTLNPLATEADDYDLEFPSVFSLKKKGHVTDVMQCVWVSNIARNKSRVSVRTLTVKTSKSERTLSDPEVPLPPNTGHLHATPLLGRQVLRNVWPMYHV
uniref:Uncharacterized protein n=1 Tax=Timema douglasi TaxID=61478 RepID=A0A7R8VIF3_TIMDO|nr:unnamed protein product [Timema douglasi]